MSSRELEQSSTKATSADTCGGGKCNLSPFWPLAAWVVLKRRSPRSVADTDRRLPDLAAETASHRLLGRPTKRIRMRDVRLRTSHLVAVRGLLMSSRVSVELSREMPFELVSSVRVENIYSDFVTVAGSTPGARSRIGRSGGAADMSGANEPRRRRCSSTARLRT